MKDAQNELLKKEKSLLEQKMTYHAFVPQY